MLRLSNLADYAVVAMVRLAESETRVSAAALAADTGIPAPTAAKLTVLLARAGLLASARGALGGVSLSRPPGAIRLTEIVEAVDGPIGLTQCLHEGADDCAIGSQCRMKPHWTLINRKVRGALSDVSLADLAQLPAPVTAHESRLKEPA
ncbi:SUF system Fe-S cluster assembly regulator [Pacificimonas sp. ICDLI1SI03]|jgi:FeS assembly SUF system regulator|tara:strand:+ start:156772 stop:157218 length:447 start_codon:yes stop_codon:yes gene_type:complete